MTNPAVISIGEVLIDFIAQKTGSLVDVDTFQKFPGGAPANFAVGIARLGLKVAFVGKVGNDSFGTFLEEKLSQEGVITDLIVKATNNERTALAFVSLDENAERDFLFYRNNAADLKLSIDEIQIDKITKAKYLHFGTVSLCENPSRDAVFKTIEKCKKADVKICFDPNIRLDLWENEKDFREILDIALYYTDILYPSKEELHFILDDTSHDNQEAIKQLMKKYPINIVALKLGKAGCLIKQRDDFFLTLPSFDVPILDTTGAGDGFNAGFIYALGKDLSLEEAGIIGNAVGALVIQKRGAMTSLPSRRELEEFLNKQKIKIELNLK
ncbi:MAG: sugar kinase [Asgard group archaeon]|nr:sugar kinase [Asgard group archaeon]